jgi:hypothetical protein
MRWPSASNDLMSIHIYILLYSRQGQSIVPDENMACDSLTLCMRMAPLLSLGMPWLGSAMPTIWSWSSCQCQADKVTYCARCKDNAFTLRTKSQGRSQGVLVIPAVSRCTSLFLPSKNDVICGCCAGPGSKGFAIIFQRRGCCLCDRCGACSLHTLSVSPGIQGSSRKNQYCNLAAWRSSLVQSLHLAPSCR